MSEDVTNIFPGRYTFNNLTLTDWSGNQIEIKNLVSSWSVEESINAFFCVYEFVIVDAVNILEKHIVTGNEKLFLSISKRDFPDSDEKTIEKKLVLTGIEAYTRPSNEGQAYKIKAISETAFRASIKRISKSAEGSPTNLLRELWGDISSESLQIKDNSEGNHKVIYPYYTYLDSMQMVLLRARDITPSPFYMFETFFDGQYCTSYSMMVGSSGSVVETFTQESQDRTPREEDEFEYNRKRIIKIQSNLGVSNYFQFKHGGISSTVHSIDISTKTYVKVEEDLYNQTTDSLYNDYAPDENFKVNGEGYSEWKNAKNYFVSQKTFIFGDSGSKNIHQGVDEYIAQRGFVNENQFSITQTIDIHGDSRVISGSIIEIVVPPAMDPEEAGGISRDDLFSGKCLVAGVKHNFTNDSEYTQTLSLRKDSIDRQSISSKYSR
jgi:hypothetical protein